MTKPPRSRKRSSTDQAASPSRKRRPLPTNLHGYVLEYATEMIVTIEIWNLLNNALPEDDPLRQKWRPHMTWNRVGKVGLGPFGKPMPTVDYVKEKLPLETIREICRAADEDIREWAKAIHKTRGEILRLRADRLGVDVLTPLRSSRFHAWTGPNAPPKGWSGTIPNPNTKQIREGIAQEIGRANEASVRSLMRNPRALAPWLAFTNALHAAKNLDREGGEDL